MSARGGELKIECRVTSDKGRKNIISFTDTGAGFSSAAIAKGTELFFSEKEGGMGIGLSVTSEILRAHGGELRLANAASGGAEVSLHLPAAN
jgi:C4-dicarboxylate-specific signal transduction histidine kinase